MILMTKRIVAGLLVLGAGSAQVTDEARYMSGGVELAGEVMAAGGDGRQPAVVISQGSGESARNNLWARAAAEMLRAEGLTVLLTDKRGSGASGGDWREVGIADRAADLLAGVSYMQARVDVDATCVGVFGLSQGGRVVPVAAAQSDHVAFVVDASGDTVSFPEQTVHEMRNNARDAGLSAEGVTAINAISVAAMRALSTGNWSEYQQLIADADGTEWEEVASGFPGPDWPDWTFYRESMNFDAMPYWVMTNQPALILFGENDEQQNVAVEESVRRLEFMTSTTGKQNIAVKVYPGLGHLLGWTNEDPFDAALRADLARFLSEVPCIAAHRGEKG